MKKNVASQSIGVQMITAADGTAFTGTVTVYVTGDAGTQAIGSVGSGVCTHEGNGFHTYAPAQAETNYDHIGFTFIGTGAIPSTVQVFTGFPQTVDNNVLAAGATGFAAIDTVVDAILADTADMQPKLGTPAGASISADILVIDNFVDGVESALATAQADLDTITGADGVTLATAQPSITFQPIIITAGDAINNITLAGSGSSDGIAFTRSGSGNPFDANFAAQIQSEAADALTAYDPPTGAELVSEINSVQTDIAAISTTIGVAGAGLTVLATQASVNTIDDFIDTEVAAIKAVTDKLDTTLVLDGAVYDFTTAALAAAPSGGLDAAGVRTAIGLATANLDTQLAALPTDADVNAACDTAISDASLATATNLATVDTVVDAIKVKTDSLTFTKAGEVDSNVQSINGVTITGDGGTTPFDV